MAELIKVLVVGNLPIISHGLSSILCPEVGIKVIGTAQNASEAVSQASEKNADVIIVGICHPERFWIQTIATLREHLPSIKVIALSISASKASLAEALKFGAADYIPEGSTTFELQEIIRRTSSSPIHSI
jgi:two-component system, NarL family, invasion response regulator UvrY